MSVVYLKILAENELFNLWFFLARYETKQVDLWFKLTWGLNRTLTWGMHSGSDFSNFGHWEKKRSVGCDEETSCEELPL